MRGSSCCGTFCTHAWKLWARGSKSEGADKPSLAILPPINVSSPPHNISQRVLSEQKPQPAHFAIVRVRPKQKTWQGMTPQQTLTAATRPRSHHQRLPLGAARMQGRGDTAVKALSWDRQEQSRTCSPRMLMRLRAVVQYAVERPSDNNVLPAQRARRRRCRWRACRRAQRRRVRPQACSSCLWTACLPMVRSAVGVDLNLLLEERSSEAAPCDAQGQGHGRQAARGC